MVFAKLDVKRIAVHPSKTDAPLIVDADAVLPGPASSQRFQSISGRHVQKRKRCGGID
jgi:hypothetical protein